MILDLCSHAVTVSPKLLVVVCGDEREKERKSFRWLTEVRRARCHGSLTVGAQGGRQHLNALVSDGVSGGEVGGQGTPGGHGAGWGGGAFGGVGFGLPVTEKAGSIYSAYSSSILSLKGGGRRLSSLQGLCHSEQASLTQQRTSSIIGAFVDKKAIAVMYLSLASVEGFLCGGPG